MHKDKLVVTWLAGLIDLVESENVVLAIQLHLGEGNIVGGFFVLTV